MGDGLASSLSSGLCIVEQTRGLLSCIACRRKAMPRAIISGGGVLVYPNRNNVLNTYQHFSCLGGGISSIKMNEMR